MFVCCECCVLSGRGLCDELITRPEESYRLLCVIVCDIETSWMRTPWSTGAGGRDENKRKQINCQDCTLSSDEWTCIQHWQYHVMTGETRRFRRKPWLGASLFNANPPRICLGSSTGLRLERPARKCLSNDMTFKLATTVFFICWIHTAALMSQYLVHPLKTKRVHEMESSGRNQGNFIWGVGGKENRYRRRPPSWTPPSCK
jgi:hypothetical protein